MTGLSRQARALVTLLWRYYSRRSLRAGAAPQQSRVPSFLLFAIVWLIFVGASLWRPFEHAARLKSGSTFAVGWQILALAIGGVSLGLTELTPEIGRFRSPLRATLLDELPIRAGARLLLLWLQNIFFAGVLVLAALAWWPAARAAGPPLAGAVVWTTLFYLASLAVGCALAAWVRVLAPNAWRRGFAIFSPLATFGAFLLIIFGPALRGFSPGIVWVTGAHAVATGHDLSLWIGGIAGVLAVGLLALMAGEAVGYDRLDSAPAKARHANRLPATRDRVEWRLAAREAGYVGLATQILILLAGIGTAIAWWGRRQSTETFSEGARAFAIGLTYLASLFALNQAASAAKRDNAARPLLSPLPISPFETLAGKVRVIRRLLAPLFLLGMVGVVLVVHWAAVVGWKAAGLGVGQIVTAIVALWLVTDAAVSVAFLSNGLGMPGARTLGASTDWATFLLLLPVLAAPAAPNLFVGLCAVGAVAAIAFEARRAAARCIRWVDDAADDISRETTVWRALIALAAFYGVQSIGVEILSYSEVPPAFALPISYGLAGVTLLALTLRGRRGLGRLQFWPRRWPWFLFGLAGGVASGAAGLEVGRLAARFGWVETAAMNTPSRGGVIALIGTLVVLAPLCEEVFFRGWLQDAIQADLAPAQRRWAFVIAALAFGLSHVGSLVVPQVILGLVAGAVYLWSGGLLPAMLVHAAHNALVLWAAK